MNPLEKHWSNRISKMIGIAILFFCVVFIFGTSFQQTDPNEIDIPRQALSTPIDPIDTTSNYIPFSQVYLHGHIPAGGEIFVIENAFDLYEFSIHASGTNKSLYLSLDYVLGRDIDYNNAVLEGKRFRPVGFLPTDPFVGTFDGQGFEITNLTLDSIQTFEVYRDVYEETLRYFSMFSIIGSNGIVSNLGLVNPAYVQSFNHGIMQYVSYLVGENNGEVHHTYVVDTRSNAGQLVNGALHLTGMVSVNNGTFRDSHIAVARVRSTQSQNTLSTTILVKENNGTINRLYYDSSIYLDTPIPLEIGAALATSAFQTASNFSSEWYFNDAYQGISITLNNSYPILKGMKLEGNIVLIQRSVDMIYFIQLMNSLFAFQNKTYRLNNDIDMASVSRDAYRSPTEAFSGIMEANTIANNPDGPLLYQRRTGDNNYFSIVNFSIERGVNMGSYASYALFSSLTGTIRNINFVNATMNVKNASAFTTQSYIAVGLLAAHANNANVQDVHVLSNTIIPTTTLFKVYLGGMVGLGTGLINNSSTNGSMELGIHTYHSKSINSAFGGLVGFGGWPWDNTTRIEITNATNKSNIVGPSFTQKESSLTYLGGLIGSGYIQRLFNVLNEGNITSHHINGKLNEVYMGGAIGLMNHAYATSNGVVNTGNITVAINDSILARAGAGFGVGANIDGVSATRYYDNIQNYGKLQTIFANDTNNLAPTQLREMDIQFAGVMVTYNMHNGIIRDARNFENQEVDVSVVHTYGGILVSNNNTFTNDTNPDVKYRFNNIGNLNTTVTRLDRAINTGDIIATTSGEIHAQQLKIAGIDAGKNANIYTAQNIGNIKLEITHDAPRSITDTDPQDGIDNAQKYIKVSGIANEFTTGRTINNIYNNGTIEVLTDEDLDIRFHIFVSGIAFRNLNNSSTRINHVLNDGIVRIVADVTGNTYASGIFNISRGYVWNTINAADVYNQNNVKENPNSATEGPFLVDSAGVLNMLTGSTTGQWVYDTLNYGNIAAYATGNHGIATAAGIITRNNRNEDQTLIINNSAQRYYQGQVRSTINYGSIYAWSDQSDSPYGIHHQTNSIAGGILGHGHMTNHNNINYGNIYSKTLAGGILGDWDMASWAPFVDISTRFVANLINYGKVRRITSASALEFVENMGISHQEGNVDHSFIRNGNHAYGGIVGRIFSGATTWNFSTTNYRIRDNYVRYWANFDVVVDVFGNTPPHSVTNDSLANTLSIQFATIKPNDTSVYPFENIRSYTLDEAPLTGDDGTDGTTYSGIFYDDPTDGFFFMNPPPVSPAIQNSIQMIPTMRFNQTLLGKIGLSLPFYNEERGIYSLGPNSGIGTEGLGLYLPDQFDLNRFVIASDFNWQTEVYSGDKTIRWKLEYGMKQLSKSLATNIENLQLVNNIANPTVRLLNPDIDLENGIIRFYVSNNNPAIYVTGQTSTSVTSYVEAASIYENYFAYLDGDVWKGTHSLIGGVYVADPGGTHVAVPTTLISSPSEHLFYVNTAQANTYTLGYMASFFADPLDPNSSINEASKAVLSFGPYNESGQLVNQANQVLDDYEDHVGRIRVFSEAYNEGDEFTYRDYKILIIRIPDQSLSELTDIEVNEVILDPMDYPNPKLIHANFPALNFKPDGRLGRIYLTFNTQNIPYGTNPVTNVRVINTVTSAVVSTSFYSFTQPNVTGAGGYNPETFTWDPGTVQYTFTANQTMPAGTYKLEFTIGTDQVHEVFFTKQLSSEALITTIQSTGFGITLDGGHYYTTIPYGMFQDNNNYAGTRILDFSNLNSILNIPATGTNTTANRPTYLTRLNITTFATLQSVTVSINPEKIYGYRTQYIVTYQLLAEDETPNTIYHYITESPVTTEILAAYKNVDLIPVGFRDYQEFPRNDAPLFRYEYDTANLYMLNPDWFIQEVDYVGTGNPVFGQDYEFTTVSNGFLFQFYLSAPIGPYEMAVYYQNSYEFIGADNPLNGMEIEWLLNFDSPILDKKGSSESKIENIFFQSDSVFVGLDTIIDYEEMDAETYEAYLTEELPRRFWLLPITGINYNETNHAAYYIIGQVSDTTLVQYAPEFVLPIGATIVRVLANDEETDELEANFTPSEDMITFNYVHYRVYAEDYIEGHPVYGTHVTDFFVAVQDVTNNVYFTIEFYHTNFETSSIHSAYLRLNLFEDEQFVLHMGIFSYFDGLQTKGSNSQFRNTSSGRYDAWMVLPTGYTFYLESPSQGVTIIDHSFFIAKTLIPRRYVIKIFITDTTVEWGQQDTSSFPTNP